MILYTYSKIQFRNFLFENNINDTNVSEFVDDYFLSILPTGGPKSTPLFKNNYNNVLTLYFDDVDQDGFKDGRPDVDMIVPIKVITNTQIKSIIEFVTKIPTSSNLHIHCVEGISRTGAIKKFVEDIFNLEKTEILYYNEYIYKLLNNEYISWKASDS